MSIGKDPPPLPPLPPERAPTEKAPSSKPPSIPPMPPGYSAHKLNVPKPPEPVEGYGTRKITPHSVNSLIPPPLPSLPSETFYADLTPPPLAINVPENTSILSTLKSKFQGIADSVKDIFSRGFVRANPTQLSSIRQNLIDQLTQAKGSALNPDELAFVDKQMKALDKINTARKSALETVDTADTKAAWTVRKLAQDTTARKITIGGVEHELQLGRNFKALLVFGKPGKILGKGGFGEVRQVGVELKSNTGLLEKRAIHRSTQEPEDLLKEIAVAKELHTKAGGHQTGIQRAPYMLRALTSQTKAGKKWGVLVHRYETTLESTRLLNLSTKERNQFGLNDQLGPVKLLKGLFTGVRAMHKAGMAHRDIKPENTGIQQAPNGKYESCLADLGLTTRLLDLTVKNIAGTYRYIPLYDHIEQSKSLSPKESLELKKKQDVYALALTCLDVLYTSATNTPSDHLLNIFDLHCSTGSESNTPLLEVEEIIDALKILEDRFGPRVRNLLVEMMNPDPYTRIDSTKANRVLKNALFLASLRPTAYVAGNAVEAVLPPDTLEETSAIPHDLKKFIMLQFKNYEHVQSVIYSLVSTLENPDWVLIKKNIEILRELSEKPQNKHINRLFALDILVQFGLTEEIFRNDKDFQTQFVTMLSSEDELSHVDELIAEVHQFLLDIYKK